MVNSDFTIGWRNAERRMILSYAPAGPRAALAALLALDDALAAVLRTTREPMVGQLRLTWWHDALHKLDMAPPPAEPVLQALAHEVLPRGVVGAELATIVEGWEELLEPAPLDDAALMRFAQARGKLLGLAGRALGATGPLEEAGQGWALADLAAHSREAARARALAAPLLAVACRHRWQREGRALGAMAHLALMPTAGAASRTLRALWHRASGF